LFVMPDEPSSSLRARVLAAAAANDSLTRPQARRRSVVLVAASAALGVTIFQAIGGTSHGAGRPLSTTLAIAGGWLLISAALTWIVLGRGGSTLARKPVVVGAAALCAPVLVFVWLHAFHGTYTEPFERIGKACFVYTLIIAALPLATFLALKRGIEPRYPAVLGAGAGAVCATWAGVLVDLWCPLTNTLHVLAGHVAPLVAATVIGALVGHFTLSGRNVR
jgi:hypothetical protein